MWYGLLPTAYCLLSSGCGYTVRPGLASHLKTVYVTPFTNRIDLTQLATSGQPFPIYRHRMELDVTNAVIDRFQFTGLLRPTSAQRADCRLEGELAQFRRDALRYNASQQVEEWRLNVVVNLRMVDQTNDTLLWEEGGLTGDATYFALGASAESETAALDRAITDLARRVVERAVESW
ncbi:MAG: LptE family protein [Candidatus Omnitrophota bacterium]|nr:LptE family protein [Candidatus Omnitrophota bacterium]